MIRTLALTVACSAGYGFSCGLVHSVGFGLRNLVKFPLLILVTAAISAVAWWIFSVFIARGLTFETVQRSSMRTFHETSVLLLSLTPVTLFLALTIEKPVAVELRNGNSFYLMNEYPFYLGLNVLFIAVCGTVAVMRQALRLIRGHGLSAVSGALVVFCWLAVALVAGGQCAWYFRPYFGLAFQKDVPFMEGAEPDFRGATSFFEAVYHIVSPPEGK